MQVNPYIFRAYDIRGIYGKDITKELFRKIGFVLGEKKEKFLVGNDIRKSGKKLARALIEGLISAGSKVIYTGTTPSGETLFAGWKLKAHASLFITASHLPPEWNGLKLYYGDGEPFSGGEIIKLRNEVTKLEDEKIEPIKARFKKINIKNEYFDFLLEKFSGIKNSNLKVVIDCGNGSMSLVAPEIFKKLGFKVIELYCKPDPSFPNKDPEPTFENTKDLREKVKKEKADFGVAFDGDGDRAVIIDDKGRYLRGETVGIIIAKYLLKNSINKKVIATIVCSMALEEELKEANIIRIPVGHTFLISNCKWKKAIFGMEESGHFCLPQYFLFDDVILIPFKIVEIILKEDKKLSEIVDGIKIYPSDELKFDCPDQIKFEVIKILTQKFVKKYKRVNIMDGVRLDFNYGWILIRASHTSPSIRLYIETKDKLKLKKIKEKFSKIVNEEIKKYESSNFGSR